MPGKPDNRPGDYCLKQSSKVVNCGSYCTGRVCRHARPHIELARPAKAEPCGMVISEAIAAQVPVVVSDACGAAAQVSAGAGAVVQLDAPLEQWKSTVAAQLDRTDAIPAFERGWEEVAKEHVSMYLKMTEEGNGPILK